jgi:phage portal protein, HK97 family|nr:MAG TPA_asm: portal protein [Bacteriophage sp.]
MTISHFFTRLFKRSYYAGGDKCASGGSVQEFVNQFNGASVSTPDRAMTIASVYRCVDILSGTIASLELQHLKRSGSIFQYAGNTQLNTLFAGQANSRQNFFVLLKNIVSRLLLSGNAYIYPRYSSHGELMDLILLGDGSVSYDKSSNTYSISDYVWNINGVFTADEIIHLKNNSLDGGYTGVSTITYASTSMSLSANADKQTNDGLLSGNQKSGFLVGGNELQGIGALDSDVADKVVDRVNNEIAQGRRIVRLSGSMQFIDSSVSNADAELLEVRKYSVLDICRFFGVHPYMVFADQSTNYKEAENSQINFLNQTLQPLILQIEQEFSVKLLPRSRRASERIRFDLSRLFATDLRTRAEYVKSSVEAGVMTPNEGRIFENREPIDGGDQLFITCNVAPITSRPSIDELHPDGGPSKSAEE